MEVLEGNLDRVRCDYDFGFFVRLVQLSGEEVRDEQGGLVGSLHSTCVCGFDRVWDNIYRATGDRVVAVIVGTLVVDRANSSGSRWSHFVSRAMCSPLVAHHLRVGAMDIFLNISCQQLPTDPWCQMSALSSARAFVYRSAPSAQLCSRFRV